jgi:hypothetical protein
MPLCPKCETPNERNAALCSNCGARLEGTPASARPEPAPLVALLLAGLGGVLAGAVLAFLLTFLVLFFKEAGPLVARASQIALIAAGVLFLVWLIWFGHVRDRVLQLFAIVTAVTALGTFAVCTSTFLGP